ncbi:MAG: hypothetical protein Q4Q23_04180 [Methanobacteriaceae archaeon]|nr:hypothetical protein [Methanobacteriaceae archaeon]
MKYITEINEQLEKDNNVILFKQDLKKYHKYYQKKYNTIYISTPKIGKIALENILRIKYKKTDKELKNKTAMQLISEINKETKGLIIFLDAFEQLSLREQEYYKQLALNNQIKYVVNTNTQPTKTNKEFFKKFILINMEDFQDDRTQSINITYTILFLISLIIFLLIIKLELNKTSLIINSLWFTLLMYRTFTYITH